MRHTHRHLAVLAAAVALVTALGAENGRAAKAPHPTLTAATWVYYNQLLNQPAAANAATAAATWSYYDRLMNKPESTPTTPAVVVAVTDGFHWGDAGIGAAAGIGIAFATLALVLLARASWRTHPAP